MPFARRNLAPTFTAEAEIGQECFIVLANQTAQTSVHRGADHLPRGFHTYSLLQLLRTPFKLQ